MLPYYAQFLAAFPGLRALARAPIERVLERWSGLGYYRRAHHLHAAARTVVDRHGGRFPRDVDAIVALPGIGRSTAAAIAVFAFGAPEAILDGNVKRVLARHRGVAGWPGAPKVEASLWQIARSLVPSRESGRYTQGLMDLGAKVCTRTNPNCPDCPVSRDCIARREQRISEIPAARPRRTLPHRATRMLVIERGGAILFERRPAVGLWSGLWSLPEAAPDRDVAMQVRARFGVSGRVIETLAPIEHGFTHFTLTLHPVRVAVTRRPPRAEAPGLVWLTREDALGAALPAPIKRIVRSLAHEQ